MFKKLPRGTIYKEIMRFAKEKGFYNTFVKELDRKICDLKDKSAKEIIYFYFGGPLYLFNSFDGNYSKEFGEWYWGKHFNELKVYFDSFLASEGVLDYFYQSIDGDFIKRFCGAFSSYDKKEDLLFNNIRRPECYICNAFDWEHSKQGRMFWVNLDKKWAKRYVDFLER